jgi:bloom syndrome protein
LGCKNFILNYQSSKKESEIKVIEENLETGSPKLKILYITPEQIISKRFQRLMKILYSKNQIPLVAIDEAHCISSWGHDFRVAYSKLSILKKNYPKSKRNLCSLSSQYCCTDSHSNTIGQEGCSFFSSIE